MISERCLRCEWWNHNKGVCYRIFKARIRISGDAGEVLFETQPGLLPKYMEEELGVYLSTIVQDLVDAWPGWREIKRIRDGGKECPSEEKSKSIEEYGVVLKLAKPLEESQRKVDPSKNLDRLGLFKSDISLL